MPNSVPNLYRWGVFRRLATRLESLDHYLDAMTEIMKFSDAEDRQIRHYGRKIISLTEVIKIAYATVNCSIGATLLVICSEENVPYKAAYFKILVLIRRRRSAFPAYLDTRISALLDYSIEHNIVLRTKGIDPRVQLGIKELIIIRKPRAARQSTIETATPVSSARGSSTGSSKTPNELLGASIPSKAVCARLSNERPRLVRLN
ncbi:hypothetical protein DFJ58DRAFT_843597 [Suillus subalutaceus]|uniref:uncharacterized protein n=1 Tax=Suillus subalutaceus TaxID=48586 RepID=UPI001B873BDD|nr:uncharacterized protein DFJ58DRAFT_843597 [Suillus subalutaceus]KAG1846075.1 hypothetical protein DFJ58DRAFT_843597 [Suillus subalutaceus]